VVRLLLVVVRVRDDLFSSSPEQLFPMEMALYSGEEHILFSESVDFKLSGRQVRTGKISIFLVKKIKKV